MHLTMLMTVTPLLKAPTLRALAQDPTTPIPHLVGGQITPGHVADIPLAHVERLLTWAAISGVSPTTTVTVSGLASNSPRSRDGFDPYVLTTLGLTLTAPTFPSVSHVPATGWNLRLVGAGGTREATLTGKGIIQAGHVDHDAEDLRRARLDRERLARIADGTVQGVAAATAHRDRTTAANAEAETLWRTAITTAVANGVKVPDVARAAHVSDKRVYQINSEQRAVDARTAP